jgi:hypothetical protein
MARIPKPNRASLAGVARTRLQFGLARDTEAFDGAFRLVHDQYVWRKYMVPHPSGRRLSLHHSLPSTKVFVAKAGPEVVGTMTLVQDSPIGLPMDEIYRDELSRLRDQHRHVCEVSSLAIDPSYRPAGVGILMRLLRMVLIYVAEVRRLDDLCIAVNPRHADFYGRAFPSCGRLGDVRVYPKVRGAPAVALHWDVDFMREQIRAVHAGDPKPGELCNFFFWPGKFQRILARLHRDLPRSTFTPQQFAHFFWSHEVLAKASLNEQAFVQSLYPERRHELLHRAMVLSDARHVRSFRPLRNLATS